jgi:hypothetical protein
MENEKCFVDFDLNCSAGPVGGVGVPQLLEVELLMRNLLNLTCLANLIVRHDNMHGHWRTSWPEGGYS